MRSCFSDLEYPPKTRESRSGRFLRQIEAVSPWMALVVEIELFYPKGDGRGTPPLGLERMPPKYVGQKCFGSFD